VPVSFLRVLGECSFNLSPEFVDLNGGSSMYPWDSEVGNIGSELSLTAREYPMSVMEMALAGTKTALTSEADGEVRDIANVKGTTAYSSVGLSDVEVTDDTGTDGTADLKEGEYVVVFTAATKVDVYALSNANFSRGTSKEYLDDTLKIATNLTISTGAETLVPGFGLSLVGGSGTIGGTVGDSLRFTVRRPLVSGFKLVVGESGSAFQEYGVLLSGQVQGDGSLSYIDMYRVKAAGMPIAFNEKAYSEWSVTLKALYDSDRDGVFQFVHNRTA